MASFFQLKERRVIPNWRDYERTVLLGELNSSNNTRPEINIDISRQIRDWNSENSIGNAADLLTSAYLSKNKDSVELHQASLFVLENKNKSSKPLIDLANEIISPRSRDTLHAIDAMGLKDVIEINSQKTLHFIAKIIHGLKNNVRANPHNAIWWVELSRLYSIVGQLDQALKTMNIAVNLAPDNRFVLRSATRLYIHFDQPDLALYNLRKSTRTKFDPWLLSAHIATTSLLDKHQVNANTAKDLVSSKKHSDFDITELTSSLGTLEYTDGSIKNSKKFFDISRKAPNDNSLAQLEWISKKDNRFSIDTLAYKNVLNPYEAYAIEQLENSNWVEAANYSIKWLYDMPYSSRPVVLGSFVCSAFLDDQEAAVSLCKLGLIANPTDATVINNLIYALALSDKVEEARIYAKQLSNISREDL